MSQLQTELLEDSSAELLLSTKDLNADMEFFKSIGFNLNTIHPTDDPAIATMQGHGMAIRLDKSSAINSSSIIHILTDHEPGCFANGENELQAPNGTIVRILPKTFKLSKPVTQHSFQVCKMTADKMKWKVGRAGMLYRDLIPDRLGGAIVASHISIPKGGPVNDMVHYHTVKFQLIYCYKGWAKLVYEDQGPPFILQAGDCVTQPPEIRHRVLESSDNMEVVEIGVPMQHATTIDHQLQLPTPTYNPHRMFNGQKFCHFQSSKPIDSKEQDGFEIIDTGVEKATQGIASVHIAKYLNSQVNDYPFKTHNCDIFFMFMLSGETRLCIEDQPESIYSLDSGDAFVVPPGLKYKLTNCSDDLKLLQVTLPKY